jgi:hypothetical protein
LRLLKRNENSFKQSGRYSLLTNLGLVGLTFAARFGVKYRIVAKDFPAKLGRSINLGTNDR